MPDTAEIGNLEDNNMYSTFWARNIKNRPIHDLIVQCIVGYKSWMVYGFYDLYKGLIRLYGKVADSLMRLTNYPPCSVDIKTISSPSLRI